MNFTLCGLFLFQIYLHRFPDFIVPNQNSTYNYPLFLKNGRYIFTMSKKYV